MDATCAESTRLLSDALDRRLTRRERAQLQKHLRICPNCERCGRQLRDLRQLVQGWRGEGAKSV